MKRIKYFLILSALYPLLSILLGCGYATRANSSEYKTIYIAPFKNNINIASGKSEYARYITYYPLLESTITRAVVDRFIFDSNLKIDKEEKSDLVLKGELASYDRAALRYASNNEDVEEYRITLWVNIALYKKGELVWQKNNFAGDATYFTTGAQAKSEKSALDDAIKDLSRRIVETVVEAW